MSGSAEGSLCGVPLAPLAVQGLPEEGSPLLASFDDRVVTVWQAHAPEVADELLSSGLGGATWRLDRTTRFRLSLPSLLARNGWAERPGRERVLALRLHRTGFEALLRMAVHAEPLPSVYASAAAFRLATRFAQVLVSWHPDLDPSGAELGRTTPRLSVRHQALGAFTREWVAGVEDATPWVLRHRTGRGSDLPVPVLRPYPLPEAELVRLAGP